MNETKIVKNSARCNKCGDVLVSHFEAQKVTCKCGELNISGGSSSLIREGDYTELTQYLLNE